MRFLHIVGSIMSNYLSFITFYTAITVTMQGPAGSTDGAFWWIVRGLVSDGAYLPIRVSTILRKEKKMKRKTEHNMLTP